MTRFILQVGQDNMQAEKVVAVSAFSHGAIIQPIRKLSFQTVEYASRLASELAPLIIFVFSYVLT